MNVLSLFDGISCGRLALERAGIKVDKYYASEIDKYAIQVAQKNYPDTIQVGDVNKLNYLELLDVDMVIGGSPCQDLSIAKQNREGLRGAKTGLYKVDLPDGDYIIRKLTPVKCERLQTLPDNWTAGVSNTQRYKAIGNGWTVDVIAHILKQIPNN